jgi:hypothetical protein
LIGGGIGGDEVNDSELSSSGYETITFEGLSFDLYGIDNAMVSSMGLIEDTLKEYFVSFFQIYRSTLEYDARISLSPTTSIRERSLRGLILGLGRRLSPADSVTFTFDIVITIKSRTETSNTDIEDDALATLPLASEEGRSAFVNMLKETSHSSFDSLTGMSEMRLP